jgi:hypothetical protein
MVMGHVFLGAVDVAIYMQTHTLKLARHWSLIPLVYACTLGICWHRTMFYGKAKQTHLVCMRAWLGFTQFIINYGLIRIRELVF